MQEVWMAGVDWDDITRPLKCQVGEVGVGTPTTVRYCCPLLSSPSESTDHWAASLFRCFKSCLCISCLLSLSIPGQHSIVSPCCFEESCFSNESDDNSQARDGTECPEGDFRGQSRLLDRLRECLVLGSPSKPRVQAICCQPNWLHSKNDKSRAVAAHSRNAKPTRLTNKRPFCQRSSGEWRMDIGTNLP